jgi:beta-glucanase (GH16 family)
VGSDWIKSNYPLKTTPYAQQYVPANVYRAAGGNGLNLRVQKYSGSGPVIGGEMQTARTDILYGSFRASLQISNVPGACQAIFYYKTDSQEVDIEFLTATSRTIHFTNQPHTTSTTQLSADPTTAYHQYRFDWEPTETTFYVDNVLKGTLTKNVPNTPGEILVNSWSNGDPQWSGGPPTQDAILKVEWVQFNFNTTNLAEMTTFEKVCQQARQDKKDKLVCLVD